MKPEKQPKIPQEDLFRMRLENMLDINHELIKLSKHIDRESPDKEWGALFVSTKGAPAIRTRLIAGLHYLKHLHDLSDEQVVKGWTENPYWQYFCGEEYFQHKMPIHPVTMTKWRNRPGKSGSEKLLIETIKAGLKSKTIKPGSLKKVTVDTTVQEKNIAFPTDSKLLNKARENLVKLSKEHGIKLRQNYNRVGPQYVLMASRYAHAKQFKRMKKMNNKLKSRLGRVKRDIERQLPNYSVDIQSLFEVALKQAQKLIEQEQHSKNKLYSLHAPEVECISKGKAHKPYELSARTIADIYKQRWQIELFFKWIKQNLKIKSFIGTTKNAVLTQIWVALCAFLLIHYFKWVNALDQTAQRIIQLLQLNWFERRNIVELFKPPDKKGSDGLNLEMEF